MTYCTNHQNLLLNPSQKAQNKGKHPYMLMPIQIKNIKVKKKLFAESFLSKAWIESSNESGETSLYVIK